MKKIAKYIFLFITLANPLNYALAWDSIIYVTESIPWVDCLCISQDCNNVVTRKYKCTVKEGFANTMESIAKILRYTTFIIALLAVLIIIVSWIQLSLSWISAKFKDEAKKRIFRVVTGMVVLLFFWFILHMVAPWIY